ncbi:DUF692 domain-containing protein [Sulfitobacter mediterraneus]|uniref:MNIO family bufferin maturase n=1 Tax=Sulfitobacter mediterraneus TaxID=83219 RepID=UPI001933B49D|nr:DUF692 domain-containing protein [Sulfitobacter mediterraneus]MBM1634123.1 DUF692 domain-containing protein [Sulfitobacter mediterraneus]MBM1641362.1 DUF692 domain-containing protein [Sulfitobacter mediterraneus]MBM1645988.1 DUF692 domain-containing protein [Sulfitobacter mediterraneus]MBM1649481.1 DUF692 domain-containing protein [Sulfitobacter mediterraneus]MBM1654056.1 DUF692 domain-containing protein [Sulfitobacter mediterraneus]
MLDTRSRFDQLPNAAGIGYKPQHFQELLEDPGAVEWVEVHAENYMGDGGRPLAQLQALSETFAISIHGVGLSIGGQQPLDKDHLNRLKRLCDRIKPASFSEHLAWSTHGAEFMNDLLPLPYTAETLTLVSDHINQVQDTLGRQMLLENPSSYLTFAESTFTETDFLSAVIHKTSCGLLLDVNNVFISSTNLGVSPETYIDTYPTDHVGEIHVGGHDEDQDDFGAPLLIDSHAKPVVDPVWSLLRYTLAQTAPKPVLVEWDNDIPSWPTLRAEANRAAMALAG